eukprot:GEMP01002422.1.p1 GENE.GEMP01002422.1~~GEMP01002422.1.p1  ORF type:complete len:1427 (+),score=240.06 GEMP01002422.1:338-4282(+)
MTQETWLWLDRRCNDPPPAPAENANATTPAPETTQSEDEETQLSGMPQFNTTEQFLDLLWNAEFCVSQYNASLQYNGMILDNIFITGERDEQNEYIYANVNESTSLELHIFGQAWLELVQILNVRFVLENNIPIPCFNNTGQAWDDGEFENVTIPDSTPLCNETRWSADEIRPWYLDENGVVIAENISDIDPHENLTFIEWPEAYERNRADKLAFRGLINGFKLTSNASQYVPDTLETMIPVCRDPLLVVSGCFEFSFDVYDHKMISDYKMDYLFNSRPLGFVMDATWTPLKIYCYPKAPLNPSYIWLKPPPPPSDGPWDFYDFPQQEWFNQEECQVGKDCTRPISMAPSARYMHTAVIYKTWNFERDAHPRLCSSRTECGIDCLHNLTCLGGPDVYFADAKVKGNFYYRTEFFKGDDGETDTTVELADQDCPTTCCGNRRMCMRKNDMLGYDVPFDRPMMLVFGGRAYKHDTMDDGSLIYHNCENMNYEDFAANPGWRSCTEEIVAELWRYDINRAQWQYMKPDTSTSVTSNEVVGVPARRFGHGAVLIIIGAENDENGIRRQYMYLFGGMGPQCSNGLCSDLWRYEIPWAPQAYYPRITSGIEWNRGNQWYLLNSPDHLCTGGCGRYRHSMVSSADHDFIYIFGGEGKGQHFSDLFRYRVVTNMWEKLKVSGFVALSRLVYNTFGQPLKVNIPVEEFDPVVDDPDPLARERCPECGPQYGTAATTTSVKLPIARADSAMVSFGNSSTLFIFGGYRTSWGTAEGYSDSGPTTGFFDFDDVDPEEIRSRYYLDDQWVFLHENSRWVPLKLKEAGPTWRRGHAIAVRRPTSGDSQIFLLGGRYQDKPLGDMWVLDIERSGEDRMWTRIDETYQGIRPPSTAYHSFIYDEGLDLFLLMGGLNWAETDLDFSDFEKNIDRRCRKNAKDLVTEGADVSILEDDDPLKTDTALIKFGGKFLEQLKKLILEKVCRDVTANECTLLNDIERAEQMIKAGQTLDMYDVLLWNFHDIIAQCERQCQANDPLCKETMANMKNDVVPKNFVNNLRSHCEKKEWCCEINDEIHLSMMEFYNELTGMDPDAANTVKASLVNRTKLWFAEPLLVHDLLNVRALARSQQWKCKLSEFTSEFKPLNSPGLWTFNPAKCPRNELGVCSGRGKCLVSHCVCPVGWSGRMCQQRRCPGSLCYTHSVTHQETCIECSNHGRCIDGQCHCDEGFTLDDCAAAHCLHNCSSTPTIQRGICIEEFPAHQCHCFDKYAGLYCEMMLCLNECSSHGICLMGECVCNPMYWGTDCSLFVFPAGAASVSAWIIVALLVVMN